MRIMRSFAADALDALMPPHEHTGRTASRALRDIPLCVRKHELLGQGVTTLMDYRAPEVRDLIRSLKYDGNAHAASLCASALAGFLFEEIASDRSFSPRPIFIVPLPLHSRREAARGFNQIEKVLRALPASLREGPHSRLMPGMLERTRDTPHQTMLLRRDRLVNVRGAFRVRDPLCIRRARVYVIDDVTTTGATLSSASAAVRRAGAEPFPIALARA